MVGFLFFFSAAFFSAAFFVVWTEAFSRLHTYIICNLSLYLLLFRTAQPGIYIYQYRNST